MPWIRSSIKERLPRNAIVGGRTRLGNTIYVGRAIHDKFAMYPCNVIPAQKAAYIATDVDITFKENYEVLCGYVDFWDRGSDGDVPSGALIGGRTISGEQIFIGRATYNGGLYLGTVQPSKGQLFIPVDGAIIKFPVYDVLCVARCEGCGCMNCVVS